MNFLDSKEYSVFKNTPIYLTGESFAGNYIPNMIYKILKANEGEKVEDEDGSEVPKKPEFKINLKGAMIIDGWVDPEY